MSFSAIPPRENTAVRASWFNLLRAAGILLEGYVGTAFLGETSFTVVNNQVAAADVTGLLFAGASVRSFVVDYQIYRNTTGGGATELAEAGQLIGVYKTVAGTWELTQAPVAGAEDSGVAFSITAAGQIQYTSTSITGTPASSTMKFKARTMSV